MKNIFTLVVYCGRLLWPILLCCMFFLQLNAQEKKAPLRTVDFTHTIYDTCQLACNLFPVNQDRLIATNNLDLEASVDYNAVCYTMPDGFNPGCLLTHYNQKWVLVRIMAGDSLNFEITNSENRDIDAAIWGPIAGQDLSNSCQALTSFPVSCDYEVDSTELNIGNAQVGEYYLLLITNFSNAKTTIHLRQPTGGAVRYSYFCPLNINLSDPTVSRQKQNAVNSVRLGTKIYGIDSIGQGNQVFSAHGGRNVLLLPGFETDSNIVFKASINACLNTSEDYSPPSGQVECESFINHQGNSPHLYSNAYQNELVGTVFAVSQPEYKAYEELGWKKMTKVGKDENSNRYLWAYREAYQHPVNVWLRTASGCPQYPDVRASDIKTYLGEDDTNLPSLSPVPAYANIDSPFALATYFGGEQRGAYDTYITFLKKNLPNLSYRINGGAWKHNVTPGPYYEGYNQRFLDVTKVDYFSSPKDFIMDFTQDGGQTIDRYIVTRNSAGGHFSMTATFTREADHSVIVHTFQGDMFVQMLLGDTPSSHPYFGNTFNLGVLPEGNYTLPLKSKKGEFTLDEGLLVRVRYGPG